MAKYLYRFRRFSDLKGDQEKGRESELSEHYIFFASPEKLNDPLEGHREMIWRGDAIVWRNLFAHYFLCLYRRHVDSCNYINIEDVPLSVKYSYLDEHLDETAQIKTLSDIFLANENVKQHIFILSFEERIVRKEELTLHFNSLHNYALHVMSQHLADQGLVKKGEGIHAAPLTELLDTSTSLIEFYNSLSNDEVKYASEITKMDVLAFLQKSNFKGNYDLWSESKNQRWMDLSINFPEQYLSLLTTLCHSNWYTACFMESCSNSAIWGTYGSEHKGACLKFKVEEFKKQLVLDLGIPQTSKPSNWTITKFYFNKVTYDGASPDLDFFRSLGAIAGPKVVSDWLTLDGKKSSCYDDVFADEKKWRADYHAHIKKSITDKTKDWSGEVEQRLLLQSYLKDYSSSNTRKLKYQFNSLESIIFGVNMPALHKFELIDMVTSLCKKYDRPEFIFNQAYFKSDRKIGYRPIYTVNNPPPKK